MNDTNHNCKLSSWPTKYCIFELLLLSPPMVQCTKGYYKAQCKFSTQQLYIQVPANPKPMSLSSIHDFETYKIIKWNLRSNDFGEKPKISLHFIFLGRISQSTWSNFTYRAHLMWLSLSQYTSILLVSFPKRSGCIDLSMFFSLKVGSKFI